MELSEIKADLEEIFRAGVAKVDPCALILNIVSLSGTNLNVDTGATSLSFDLSDYKRIVVIGFGKATAKMALAMEQILGDRISAGVIAVKYGHTEPLRIIKAIEAGHPIPDLNGAEAAGLIAQLAQKAKSDTLVFTLISGGGSALIPCPLRTDLNNGETIALSLEEKQEVTQILLESGATISEVNCVRKHLSGIKGGRLAEMLMPATSVNLILSDVVGDRLDSIASGATSPDESSFEEMAAILENYRILRRLPPKTARILEAGLAGELPETPRSGNAIFEKCHTLLIGNNRLALNACRERAKGLGYETRIMTSVLTGEAKEVAKVLSALAKEVASEHRPGQKPVCLLFGGETTVTINGKGKGGRNQEMALSFLAEMASDPESLNDVYFLAASTDGNDGPTDAAGAFAAVELLRLSKAKGLDIRAYLQQNDSYHFFAAIQHLLKTGPTNTNVCDIQIVLIPSSRKQEK